MQNADEDEESDESFQGSDKAGSDRDPLDDDEDDDDESDFEDDEEDEDEDDEDAPTTGKRKASAEDAAARNTKPKA